MRFDSFERKNDLEKCNDYTVKLIRNDLVHQSHQVYVTSNEFQLPAYFAWKEHGASNLKTFKRDIGPSRILFRRNKQDGQLLIPILREATGDHARPHCVPHREYFRFMERRPISNLLPILLANNKERVI